MSPDGKNVYVTADTPGSVSVFSRDADSGDLEPVMCVSESGSDGLCADGTALTGASSVTVAPDGRQVFVTAAAIGGVTAYARDADTGALAPQKSCLLDRAPKGGSCRSAPALAGAAESAITPDGKTLLVASAADQALALFARNADTGALTPSSCFVHQNPSGDDAVQDEGEDEESDDEEADDAQADCKPAKALDEPNDVVICPTAAACSCSAATTTSRRSSATRRPGPSPRPGAPRRLS